MKGGVVAGLGALRAIAEAGVELDGEADARHRAQRGGRRRRDAGGDPGRAHRRLGGDHRADPARDRHRPGGRDHVHADRHRPQRPRRLPPPRRLGGREAAAGDGRPGATTSSSETRPSSCSRCATSACPTPPSSAGSSAGDWSSTVPERLVAEGRYGVRIGQTVAEARGRAARRRRRGLRRRRVAARAPGRGAGDRRAVRVGGGAVRPPAALGGWARPPATCNGRLPPFVGVPYGSDARLLIDQGATPTVLYGPGDPELRPHRRRARRRWRTSPAARGCSRCG